MVSKSKKKWWHLTENIYHNDSRSVQNFNYEALWNPIKQFVHNYIRQFYLTTYIAGMANTNMITEKCIRINVISYTCHYISWGRTESEYFKFNFIFTNVV